MTKDTFDALVARIAAGNASDADQARFQQAVESGQVQLVTGDGAVALGGNATDAVIVTGSENIVQIVRGTDADGIEQAFETARTASPESEYQRLMGESKALYKLWDEKHQELRQLNKQRADMINSGKISGRYELSSQINKLQADIDGLGALLREKDKRLSKIAKPHEKEPNPIDSHVTPQPEHIPNPSPLTSGSVLAPRGWLWATRIHWRFIFEWIVATTVSFPLAWILAVQVGDPLGGVMFDAVDFIMTFFTEDKPPDQVGSAGKYATFGVVVGIVQWYVLGKHRNRTTWWILAMALGLALGGIVFEATEETFLGGAVFGGAVFGIVQWIWLQHHDPTKAAWWIVVTAASSTLLHYMLTSLFPEENIVMSFVWLGAIWGTISALFLHWLLRIR